jgi:hypothetical protein
VDDLEEGEFEFFCWRCDESNVIEGEPIASFWTQRYRLPGDWRCWRCRALNTTPDE